MITGSGAWMKPYSVPDPDTGECEPHAAISYAACVAEVEVDDETGEVQRPASLVQAYDVGRAINPTLVEGQIEGGAIMGLGLGVLEESYPYYPANEHRGGEFGAYLAPTLADLPEFEAIIVENPSVDRAVRRQGDRRDGQQRPGPAICAPSTTRRRRLGHRAAGDARAGAAGAGRAAHEPRREGKRVIFDEEISLRTVSETGGDGFLRVDD